MTTDLTPDEQELHELIERSLTDVLGDAHRFEAGAVTRGRTIRRRRRIGAGLAGAAVAATVAALVVPAVSGDSGTGRGLDPAQQSSRQPASTAPGPGQPGPLGWWSMPADVIHDRLLPLLPNGVLVDDFELAPPDRAAGEPDVSTGWLHATLTGAAGQTGDFEILMYPPDTTPSALTPDPAQASPTTPGGESSADPGSVTTLADAPSVQERISCPANTSPDKSCVEIQDAQGHHVGRLLTWTPGDLVVREATVARADGGAVYVATANSTDDKWGWGSTTSADTPPLTLDDLRAIAESDTWTDWEPPSNR